MYLLVMSRVLLFGLPTLLCYVVCISFVCCLVAFILAQVVSFTMPSNNLNESYVLLDLGLITVGETCFCLLLLGSSP